jgi:hypothetical protein
MRGPRRPRTALPVPLLLPRWLALLLSRRHRRSASVSRPAFLNQGDAPFTPQAYPQLSPTACAVLNTPLKDCDPETLELVLSAFAQHISEVMSPEAGITDREATLPSLWQRLSTALADIKADTSLPAPPDAAPATPTDAVPEAPALSPDPPVQAPPTEPTRLWTNDAPRVSPVPLSGPPASDQPADAMITAAAPETTPGITAPSAPVVQEVGHCPTLADRSSTTYNLLRAGAADPSAAADRFSLQACEAGNACRRHGDFITPLVLARPEGSRAESGACRGNERGHRTGVPPP